MEFIYREKNETKSIRLCRDVYKEVRAYYGFVNDAENVVGLVLHYGEEGKITVFDFQQHQEAALDLYYRNPKASPLICVEFIEYYDDIADCINKKIHNRESRIDIQYIAEYYYNNMYKKEWIESGLDYFKDFNF